MRNRPLLMLVVAFAVLLGVALVAAPGGSAQDGTPTASPTACPEGTPTGSPAAGAATASPEASPAASPTACAAAREATVTSHDIYFDPKEVTIPADTDVTVMLPNEGVTLHNFSIDKLGISVDIDPGTTEQVVINAPAGTYEYYCNVPGHKAAGMLGTLTVT